MSTPTLTALEPPYVCARRMHGSPPMLGAVLLLDAVDAPIEAEHMRATAAAAPWCPLVVIARSRANVRQVRRSARVTVVYEKADLPTGVNDVLGAVATRTRPTTSDIVEWVVERTGLRMVTRTLCDVLGRPALEGAAVTPLPFAVRDRLAQLGQWGAVEWQHAARIAESAGDELAVDAFLSARDSFTALARRRMTELLGLCERDLRQRAGWEWVLETALWQSGFFTSRSAASYADARPTELAGRRLSA